MEPRVGRGSRRRPAGWQDGLVDHLAAFFDSRARSYDRQLWLERSALRTAARLVAPAPGERVVDVAAGTGAMALALAQRQPDLASLVLVDAAPRMLARAGHRLRGAYAHPQWLVADARSIPLAPGSADIVSIAYLLHLLTSVDVGMVLAEARALLAPQGRLVVVVHGCPPGPFGAMYRRAWSARARLSRDDVVGQGPMTDVVDDISRAGLAVTARRWVPGAYMSEVVVARRPPARKTPAQADGSPPMS